MRMRSTFLAWAAVMLGLTWAGSAHAATGDNLRNITANQNGTACADVHRTGDATGAIGTGIAFDGENLLVSCWSDNTVVAVSPVDGSQVTIHHIPGVSGLGALAWDNTDQQLWACRNPPGDDVGTIDLVTNTFTFKFTSKGCTDGLAFDGNDDTIWSSADVSTSVQHYHTNGTLITDTNIDSNLGGFGNSGIAVGGAKLYLANNGGSEIYEVPKDFSTFTLFASFPRRLEDLECDNITFLPDGKAAIWSNDAYDNELNAWEIPFGVCLFGGGPPAHITLTPKTATNQVGSQHCVTATVTNAIGNPKKDIEVVFSASGANSAGGTQTTDTNGMATFCYVGTVAGSDTITGFADANKNGVQDMGEPSDTAQKTWTPGPPFTLTLTPKVAENPVTTQHCVTATSKDSFGNATPGITVRFSVSGVNAGQSGSGVTGPSGMTTFCYVGSLTPGSDIISAYADTNHDNVQDQGEPGDTANKLWRDVTPPNAGCLETTNPHGQTIPPAGTTLPGTKGGQNPDGFYQLSAVDLSDPSPLVYVLDTGSGTVFGPYASGTKIKYTEANGATPEAKKIGSTNGQAGAVAWHITGTGDAAVYAVDASGNVSARVSCLVPPPPK